MQVNMFTLSRLVTAYKRPLPNLFLSRACNPWRVYISLIGLLKQLLICVTNNGDETWANPVAGWHGEEDKRSIGS